MTTLEQARIALDAAGQSHVLKFWEGLTDGQRSSLLAQVASLNLAEVPGLVEGYVKRRPDVALPGRIDPASYYPSNPGERRSRGPWDSRAAMARGEALLSAGRVACFTVAGGQGSRLGYDGPKGCYPAGAVTGKSLFQFFAEGILAAKDQYGMLPPWYVMTSPQNHEATLAFFERHRFFGLPRDGVMFFPQGVMASLEMGTGRVLMAQRHEIATNPDGHGGALRALHASGAVADMKRRGIDVLSYFQVDNPNVNITDPVFIGLHAAAPDSSAEMSSKMVPKSGPDEKVGVFCRSAGKLQVIEYSDLPAALANARDAQGRLRFLAGSIAIHMLGVSFIEKVNADPSFALPWHRAVKKVPHVDLRTGQRVEPKEPNAVKLERFVFDAIPLARSSIVLETDRVEEFAPVKNATGVDSIETSRQLQTEKAARWLETVGVKIPRRTDGQPDCVLELSGVTAITPDRLDRQSLPQSIDPGSVVAI